MSTGRAAAFFWRTGLKTCLIGRIIGAVLAPLLIVGSSASATELIGKVMNGTTKKPSTGDEVVLLTLSNHGTNEAARARTDSGGRFRFNVSESSAHFLLQVIHQGVAYDEPKVRNGSPIVVYVYDVVNSLVGVTAVMDVQRFEATSDKLEVKQLVTMRNGSKPPRTLLDDHPFEFRLPPEAQVRSGLVQIEDGQPLREKPIPGERKGEYYFRYPLRPGDTRFAVVYQLLYNGEALIEPKIRDPQERFVVMLPKSMKFEPQAAGVFRPMPDVSPDSVLGTTSLTPGQTVAFRIFGTGMLAELQASRQRPLSSEPPRQSAGLTRPPKAPSPLSKSHPLQNDDSFMLVGITVALAVGMVTFYWKKQTTLGVAREPKIIHTQQLQPRRDRRGTRFRMR